MIATRHTVHLCLSLCLSLCLCLSVSLSVPLSVSLSLSRNVLRRHTNGSKRRSHATRHQPRFTDPRRKHGTPVVTALLHQGKRVFYCVRDRNGVGAASIATCIEKGAERKVQ